MLEAQKIAGRQMEGKQKTLKIKIPAEIRIFAVQFGFF